MNAKQYYIGLISTMILTGGVIALSDLVNNTFKPPIRSPENPRLVVIDDPKVRNFSKHPGLCYIDEAPFGSLDIMVDYSSGERVERKPNVQEHTEFGRLEQQARDRGYIVKK